MTRIRILNETRDCVLAESAGVADSSGKRRKGLLGRAHLPPGDGLWIVPCQGVHTCGMKFAIDLLYLDRRKKIRKLRKAMVPWRFSVCLLANSILELPAGTIEQSGTQLGDQLNLLPLR